MTFQIKTGGLRHAVTAKPLPGQQRVARDGSVVDIDPAVFVALPPAVKVCGPGCLLEVHDLVLIKPSHEGRHYRIVGNARLIPTSTSTPETVWRDEETTLLDQAARLAELLDDQP